MRRRTPPLLLPIGTIPASACPAPNLVTYFSNREAEGYFGSADFHDGDGKGRVGALSAEYENTKEFFSSENNTTFKAVEIPMDTMLYHWRSSVYPREGTDGSVNTANLERLPANGDTIHTDDYLYANTAEEWMYNPAFDDYFDSNTTPMAVFMRIRIQTQTPVMAWKDGVPMTWEECKKDPAVKYPLDDSKHTPHHSDLVLPPSTFKVTRVSDMSDTDRLRLGRSEASKLLRQMRLHRRNMRKFPVYDKLFAEKSDLRAVVIDLDLTHTGVVENVVAPERGVSLETETSVDHTVDHMEVE